MLTNISITNYKSIRDENIPLSPLTLFTGLNGLGKSSVMQVILLLRQSLKDGGFSKGLFLRDDDLLQLGLGKDVFSIDADIDEKLAFSLEWNYENELCLEFKTSQRKDVLPLSSVKLDGKIILEEQALFSNNFQYLSANRINPQVQYKTSSYFVDEINSLGKTGEYTVHYLAKNQDRVLKNKLLQHPQAKSDTLIDNVNAWLSEISPGIKVNATYHQDLEIASLGYRFERKNDFTDSFKPTHVGFGLTYVLPVVTALLMSERGSMVIVENPESHLHPAGQSKIGLLCALAANAGIQVILESHSDHVLNGIRVAVKQNKIKAEDTSIYYFQRDRTLAVHESEIIPLYIDEKGRIDEWPKGFMDEWEKQLDELLTEDGSQEEDRLKGKDE